MATEVQHFIGGKLVPGRSGRMAPVFDRATGEQSGTLPLASRRRWTRRMHGSEGVRFYTRLKTITSRWPPGIRQGADFVMPTMR